jgi:hypothetical protein
LHNNKSTEKPALLPLSLCTSIWRQTTELTSNNDGDDDVGSDEEKEERMNRMGKNHL